MPRLLVNPGSAEAWEIELKPGANSLGRGEENDFPIEHSSVSNSHCQIIVMGRNALLRDVGSVNGTFVEGRLVEEAQLRPGQLFQLGSVEMRYESDEAAGPEEASPMDQPPQAAPAVGGVPLPPRLASPAAGFCKSHPRSMARFACPKCGYHFCELCVSTRQSGGRARKFCRACGVECAPLGARPAGGRSSGAGLCRPARRRLLVSVQRRRVILLGAGTVFYAILNAASFFAMFAGSFWHGGDSYADGLRRRLSDLPICGASSPARQSARRKCRTGRMSPSSSMTSWRRFSSSWEPWLRAFCRPLAVSLFVAHDNPWAGPALVAAILFGCVCFPMAFLAVSMFDSVAAVNPLLVIPSILRIPLQYLLTVLLLGGVLALRWAGEAFLENLLPIPILAGIVLGFAGLYLLTVEMRILGLLYLANKDRLGWFNR